MANNYDPESVIKQQTANLQVYIKHFNAQK
jgi:hypothetical protein